MPDTQSLPRLIAYPATIVVTTRAADGTEHTERLRNVKVFQEGSMLVAYRAIAGMNVEIAAVLALPPDTTLAQGSARSFTVTSADGLETWDVTRAGGCGCGSPLKRFTPGQQPRRAGT